MFMVMSQFHTTKYFAPLISNFENCIAFTFLVGAGEIFNYKCLYSVGLTIDSLSVKSRWL